MKEREQQTFPIQYWGADKSTQVQFTPLSEVPEGVITACFVVARTDDGKIAISRPSRGWGLPGGHVEPGETPEDCIRREAKEEADIELGDLKLVGGWKITKRIETSDNAQYPSRAHQLLYSAKITYNDETFATQHEILERAFIELDQLPSYHYNFAFFEPAYGYIRSLGV